MKEIRGTFSGMNMRHGTLDEFKNLILLNIKCGTGFIAGITGPMFSQKTKLDIFLINTIREADNSLGILAVKPFLDTRSGRGKFLSYDDEEANVTDIDHDNPRKILDQITEDTSLVVIDECHLFDRQIALVVQRLADAGKIVIATGLDKDSNRVAFTQVAEILALAHIIAKLVATCVICDGVATDTYRKAADTTRILIGWQESYDAVCTFCHMLLLLAKKQGIKMKSVKKQVVSAKKQGLSMDLIKKQVLNL